MDSKYKYTYEWSSDYCYKGTDILINRFDIMNDELLYDAERELVAYRIYELNEKPLKGDFSFNHLKDIHKYLFQDIYEWAGNVRKCNIAKQDLFCLAEHIESYAKEVFGKLNNENYFMNYDSKTKIDKLVELFSDINALHPFREGNGRSQRIFIESLAKINGINLDLTTISKNEMIIASHESINGHYEKLTTMFKENSNFLKKADIIKYINMYCNDNLKERLLSHLEE